MRASSGKEEARKRQGSVRSAPKQDIFVQRVGAGGRQSTKPVLTIL